MLHKKTTHERPDMIGTIEADQRRDRYECNHTIGYGDWDEMRDGRLRRDDKCSKLLLDKFNYCPDCGERNV